MNKEIRAIEQEIEITAASLQHRTAELDEQVRGLVTVITTGAKVIGRRYPWALLAISVATGVIVSRAVTAAPKQLSFISD